MLIIFLTNDNNILNIKDLLKADIHSPFLFQDRNIIISNVLRC